MGFGFNCLVLSIASLVVLWKLTTYIFYTEEGSTQLLHNPPSSQQYGLKRADLHESAIPCGYQIHLYFTYQMFRQRDASFADFHICVATRLSHQYLQVSRVLLC